VTSSNWDNTERQTV